MGYKKERPTTSKLDATRSVQEPIVANLKSDDIETIFNKVLTGDDFLIEYVSRTVKALKQMKDDQLEPEQKKIIQAFLNHPAWISVDHKSSHLN